MLFSLFRAAFRRRPATGNARALALRRQGDLAAATAALQATAAENPRDPATAVNLALVLIERGEAAAGAAELERALALDPTHGAAHYNYANLLRASGRHADAIKHYEAAVAAADAPASARQELMFASLEVCDWGTAERHARLLREHCDRRPADWPAAVGPLTAMFLGLPAQERKHVAAWHARRTTDSSRSTSLPARRRRPRPRIAYLSPDFGQHPVGELMAAALPHHDRSRVEVFAYAYGANDGSDNRRAIEAGVEHFVDVARLSDAQAAARVADDDIDVLVDLAGHTTESRLGILARRPAPVQAHYLGYPGTLGAEYVDYYITDAVATPPGCEEEFSEKVARVPSCFMPSARLPAKPLPDTSRAAAGLPEDAPVFAAFTNPSRITREVYALWLEILRAVPDSVLWLRLGDAAARERLRRAASASGIDPARIIFAERTPARIDHVARLALADLALDPVGWHNGHSTTADLLGAGLPVLTMPGDHFAARVGASLVTAADMPELVAADAADYVARAIDLGRDRARCATLKAKLVANRATAPLFDNRRIVAGLEDVLIEMVRRHAAGEPPGVIDIAAIAARETGPTQ